MKTIFSILFLPSILFVTLNLQAQSTNAIETAGGKSPNFISKAQKATTFNLKEIVGQIAAYGTLDAAATGFSGKSSEQYDRLIKLMMNANDSQLMLLCDHTSANVKA